MDAKEKSQDLVPVSEDAVLEVHQVGELSDADADEIAGGLTNIKNANCQNSKGALNSVVTVEASLKL